MMEHKKRIAYGKVGRVIEASPSKWGQTGGDNEPPKLLDTLARRHPDVEWVVVGKNTGWEPTQPNVVNMWREHKDDLKMPSKWGTPERVKRYDEVCLPWFDGLDGVLLWLGQHGSSNFPIPSVADRSQLTSPQVSFVNYSSFLLRGINYWRRVNPLEREETWLIADVRNYLKARDLKWGRRHPILGQFDFERWEKCERYGDPSVWPQLRMEPTDDPGVHRTLDRYVYSGLELVGVDTRDAYVVTPFEDRQRFGILINEARAYGGRPENARLPIMRDWVKPLGPAWVHGTWPQASQDELGMSIQPAPYGTVYDLLSSARTTFTTPSSGSGWATAKPWEAFAVGAVCFFHPGYDSQGHIIPTRDQIVDSSWDRNRFTTDDVHLASWLRVESPEALAKRVDAVAGSPTTWEWLARAQSNLLRKRVVQDQAVTMIERRLGL